MWTYLRGDEAKCKFEVDGRRIYMNRDTRKSAADEARDHRLFGNLSALSSRRRAVMRRRSKSSSTLTTARVSCGTKIPESESM